MGRRVSPTSSGTSHEMSTRSWSISSASPTRGSVHAADEVSSNADVSFTSLSNTQEAQVQHVSGNSPSWVDLSTQMSLLNDSFTFDGLLAFDDDSLGQLQYSSEVSAEATPSWCTWTRRGFSLAVVAETPAMDLNTFPLSNLQLERPHNQQTADLVIQSLRSFPTMMLRKETFPWFIHPQSHLLSTPTKDALPEALSACMSISHMFTLRTPETICFLWRAISAEYRRFNSEVCDISPRAFCTL